MEDRARLAQGLEVGDSGLVAPRIGGSSDRRTGVARRVARLLFPAEDAERSASYIRYGQLLSRLRRCHLAQEEQARLASLGSDRFRLARLPGHRADFEALLGEGLSDAVRHPAPMPVTVAPLDDLTPFFSHVTQGTPAAQDCVRFTRGAYYRDGRVDMCKQVVAEDHIAALVESVRRNANVRHFLLGNNIVGDHGAREISRLLGEEPAAPELETLYLAGNQLGAEGIASLALALRGNRTVKSLWLKRNPLHPEGIAHLATLLEENDTLETLDLVNTAVFDEGVAVLFKSLRHNRSLRSLYLDANGVTVDGARHIADYFAFLKASGRTGLTGLFLGINRLGDEGARIIAEGVRGYAPLVRLDLASNRIQDPGLACVLDAAATLPNLRYLGVGLYKSTTDMGELPNYFDGPGADRLAAFLRGNRSVQVLDIRDTNLRPGGLEGIAEALQMNRTLLHLYYGQIALSHDKALAHRIENALARNVRSGLGMELAQFRGNPLRFIKHTPSVVHIDSIYRNRM